MDRDVIIKDIGIGLREWTFEHVDTQCRFVLTKSPAFLNLVGLETFPLLYRHLTKTSGGRVVSIPLVRAGNHQRIVHLSEGIDRVMMEKGGDLAFHYSLVVGKKTSRMIWPCPENVREMGRPEDGCADIIESIQTIMKSASSSPR